MLFLVIFSILLGGVLTLVLQAYLFYIYFHKLEVATEPVCQPKVVLCKLPEKILKFIENKQWKNRKESCIALNLIFQFLFREWKDTIQMKRWFTKKLSTEFLEMQRTATGRLLDKITVRDLLLGKDLPTIKSFSIDDLVLSENHETVECLDICMEIEYNGKFQLAVDVDMVLGRTASLSVSVTKLEGPLRLQLTRNPFSHWSIAFYEEPAIEFLIESQFQGRQLPQIKSLITNQIRRSLRKKHTLPNYKLRFGPLLPVPFFPINPYDALAEFKATEGVMEVTVLHCSRLQLSPASNIVFCTLVIDSRSWSESSKMNRDLWSTNKLEVVRQGNQSLGIMFKQEFVEDRYENCVIVETVASGSPAYAAGMRKNDIIVSVEGAKVTNSKEAIKLFKTVKERFSVSVERKIVEKRELPEISIESSPQKAKIEKPSGLNSSPLKINPNNEIKYSVNKNSSAPCTPSRRASIEIGDFKTLRKVSDPIKDNFQEKIATSDSMLKADAAKKSNSANSSPVAPSAKSNTMPKIVMSPHFQKTKTINSTQNPAWNELFKLALNPKHKFLNVGVWCRTSPQSPTAKSLCQKEDILIGHTSIAVHSLLEECASTTQGTHFGVYPLLPPSSWLLDRQWQKLSRHRGFDQRLCCGDISLYFQFEPKYPVSKSSKMGNKAPKVTPDLPVGQSSPSHKNVLDLQQQGTESAAESDEELFILEDNNLSMGHDFISTQFHSAAMCNFCKKKIWLKVAYQCRSCAMICHKKCISKCQLETSCGLKGLASVSSNKKGSYSKNGNTDWSISESNAKCTSPSGSPQHQSSTVCRKNLNTLFTNLANVAQRRSSLTRSGSSHNLALPTSGMTPVSKSLPPSPHHSPAQSRKCSLQDTPYSWLDSALLEEENIPRTLDLMLRFPCDDQLLGLAKEKGKELYINLGSEERLEKLNGMLERLQEAMDTEALTRSGMAKKEQGTDSPTEKTKLAFLIAKSDERSQALATLMLLYLSGLQHCTSNPESEKQTPSPLPEAPAEKISFRCERVELSIGDHIPKLDIPTGEDSQGDSFGHAISVTAPSPVVETLDFSLYENALLIRDPDRVQLGRPTEIFNGIDPIWEENRLSES